MTIQYYVDPQNTSQISKYSGTEYTVTLPDGRVLAAMMEEPDGEFDLWPEGSRVVRPPNQDGLNTNELYSFNGSSVDVTYEQIPV